MLLKELHDQSPPLVQGAPQRRVGDLIKLQLPQDVLPVRAWGESLCYGWEQGQPGLWFVCVCVYFCVFVYLYVCVYV